MSSSEHDHTAPLPPPPPPPPLPPPPLSTAPSTPSLQGGQQTSPLRRIAVQPPRITTSLAPPQGTFLHTQTPVSATTLSAPFSPYAPSPSPYVASPITSPMATRNPTSIPYNPQQWGRNGPVAGQYMSYSASQTVAGPSRQHEITGMEAAMPSPPPPYSPGRGQNLTQAARSSPHLSSNAFTPPLNPPTSVPSEYVPSAPSRPMSGFNSRPTSMSIPASATSVTSNPSFPPPPPRNARDRSSSRDPSRSKFSLSALRLRAGDHSPAPSAIESLRISTTEAISRAPGSPGLVPSQTFGPSAYPDRRWSPDSPVRAPAARRAASAGAVGLTGEITRTPIEYSPSPSQSGWEPRMPLPPPPPGPPPSSSRSQSLGRVIEPFPRSSHSGLAAPPTRRPGQGSMLTPIPPTPVGWQDEETQTRSKSPAARGLAIDTSSFTLGPAPSTRPREEEDVSLSPGPTAFVSQGSLYRDPPKRESSNRGIRERRSESRAARERTEPNNNPWAEDMDLTSARPTDLVLTGTPDGLSRRGAVTRNTPRSGKRSSQLFDDPGSSNSTPRVESHKRVVSGALAPTPPFSPGMGRFDHDIGKAATAVPSKALPTPPYHSYSDDHTSDLTNVPEHLNRPRSRTLHTPEADADDRSLTTPRQIKLDTFAQGAVERHRQFVEREMAAQSDQERLELFAEFIVAESRLRRDRYSAAFDGMASDILDLTRDMWRSYNSTGRRSTTPGKQSATVPSGRQSQASTTGESADASLSVPNTSTSETSSVGNYTPHTEPNSPSSATSQGRSREQIRNSSYQPCLSPIPSMAMSTIPDEEDSRGRSSSRWWEASADGASTGRGGRGLERSKRESKYMGVPKELRESLQWAGEDQASPAYHAGSSDSHHYGPNEYPPEKVGLPGDAPSSSFGSHPYYPTSAPATPDPHKLDVSRLVTLPPAYPRHHPAVNNNHPDLASIRSNLRSLLDLEEVKSTKERFKSEMDTRRKEEQLGLTERRSQLRYNIQDNLRSGVMTYADAAKAEAEFDAREHKKSQDMVQNVFDTFQTEVANPLHALFCERITKASASVEHLRGRLSNVAQELNPNQTQEEGDEQPELLEILTLLKWLFEAREQLHREMFELENERNDLYKDIILLPYQQAGNKDKVKEANDFFQRDAQDRKVSLEKGILKRYEEFMNVVEQNVTRGVEAQLSAFWDIAPGLLAIVQKVPQRLHGFDILIPPQEYEENPAYHDFPLQYLYSLLAHAGRSAYQFIESQINLLCLLHEVKTGVMTAGSRLLETQRCLEGEDLASVDQEMKAIRADEEARLTEDLKDKVALVESQWNEALGKGLEDCKNRVEAFLVQQDGWDDSLKE
ncbi:hypothetical protein GQ43DRAFT_428899 [Delitschia confertaspora ATCC 74209]|uniref:Uncharacterized protein n=1 Tax=Delitschia confertaspora ATCC 74209 TaxID=1513339 RepID=A0A9P4MST8_9PLEO|nr:hypothetical protein GQ43DRAFT_428899 [Delitschia confertaspora ATCC 74209]